MYCQCSVYSLYRGLGLGWTLMCPLSGMRKGLKMHDPCVHKSYLLFRKPCHRQRSWNPVGGAAAGALSVRPRLVGPGRTTTIHYWHLLAG